MNFVNLTGTQFLADTLLLSGNVFYRHLNTESINGNVNDSYLDSSDYVGPPIDCGAPPTTWGSSNETAADCRIRPWPPA